MREESLHTFWAPPPPARDLCHPFLKLLLECLRFLLDSPEFGLSFLLSQEECLFLFHTTGSDFHLTASHPCYNSGLLLKFNFWSHLLISPFYSLVAFFPSKISSFYEYTDLFEDLNILNEVFFAIPHSLYSLGITFSSFRVDIIVLGVCVTCLVILGCLRTLQMRFQTNRYWFH